MRPTERFDWIESHLRQLRQGEAVDVLNAEFVDAYLDATNARCFFMPYGAHKCPQLGRDLAAMHKAGKLRRCTSSVNGGRAEGFPTWVYSYRLPKERRYD